MLSERFAARLKYARGRKKLSQFDVAVALGVKGTATVYKWEKGDFFPGLDTVEKLGNLLGVDPHWFFMPGEEHLKDLLSVPTPERLAEIRAAYHRRQAEIAEAEAAGTPAKAAGGAA